jgi:hypothetical protein
MWQRNYSFLERVQTSANRLTKKINFCQIDNFVTASARDSFKREQTKTGGLFQSDCRGHGEFLSMHDRFDQRGPIVSRSMIQNEFFDGFSETFFLG